MASLTLALVVAVAVAVAVAVVVSMVEKLIKFCFVHFEKKIFSHTPCSRF